MNLILSAASFVVIVVALGVLSSMRIGITPWVQFPTWLGVAMAGMLWRHRHRLAWEVAHPPRTPPG